MILMLWFYMSGLVILLGAEMNAEIEHASPYGKDAGEKVPGQKRKIGMAAMRAWMANRAHRGEKPPSADEVKAVVGPTPPDKDPANAPSSPTAGERATARPLPPTHSGGFSDYLIGAGIVAAQAFFTLKVWKKGAKA
jgi:hypothetical protein